MNAGQLLAWLLRERERQSEHNFNNTPVWIEDREGTTFSVKAVGSYDPSQDLWLMMGEES